MPLKVAREREVEPAPEPEAQPAETAPGLTPSGALELQRSAGNQAVQRMLSAPRTRSIGRFSDQSVRDRAAQVSDWIEAKVQVRAHEIFEATKRGDEQANYFEAKKQVEEAWKHLTTLRGGGKITSAEWAVMKLGLSSDEYATALALVDTAVGGSDWKRAAELLNSMTRDDAYRKLSSLTDAQIGDVCNTGAGAAAINLNDAAQPLSVAAQLAKSLVSSGRSRAEGDLGHVTGAIRFEGTPVNGSPGVSKAMLPMKVVFEPDAGAVQADEIAYIQIVRRFDTASGANRNINAAAHHARELPDHWKVDRVPNRDFGWYGFEDSGAPGGNVEPWTRAGGKTEAVLHDAPSVSNGGLTIEFETAVVSKAGPDAGHVYATCTWGMKVDASLVATLIAPQYFIAPTAKVGAAVTAWNTQAAGTPADRNSPGQKPLPGIK